MHKNNSNFCATLPIAFYYLMWYYNTCKEEITNEIENNFLQKIKITIDKRNNVCYNKYIIKKRGARMTITILLMIILLSQAPKEKNKK